MELNKCSIDKTSKTKLNRSKIEEVDENNSVLLGFKNGVAVLAERLETSNGKLEPGSNNPKTAGNPRPVEKFIFLNGKKLKMVSQDQLPQHLRSMQALKGKNAKPIVKVISKTMKRPNLPPQKAEADKSVPIPIVNKDKSELSPKTILIEKSKLQSFKNSSSSSVPEPVHNGKELKIDLVNRKLVKIDPVQYKCMKNARMMRALDLTKPNVKKCDKSEQTEDSSVKKEFADKEVQTGQVKIEDVFTICNLEDLLDFDLFKNPGGKNADNSAGKQLLHQDSGSKLLSAQKQMINDPERKKKLAFYMDLTMALHSDVNGNFPIHNAVIKDDLNHVKRCCSVLKVLGKSLNILSNNEMTPLQLAVIHNSDPMIVDHLILHGAGLRTSDPEGNNILHLLVEHRRTDILETVLSVAEDVDTYIKQFNAEGLTPLMLCCQFGLTDCAQLLLINNADPNMRDKKSGRTALFHAAEQHNVEMVRLLLKFNADTKLKNYFGTSPHDAMYEVDDIPNAIKMAILGKNKRRAVEEPKPVPLKVMKIKTYSKLQKIDYFDVPAVDMSI